MTHLVCGLQGEGLAPAAAASIRSVLDSFDPQGELTLHFLYADVGAEVRQKLELSWRDPRFSVNWVEAAGALAPVADHPMRGSFLRLFMGELLPDISRVIWLDIDLLVYEDISQLWRTDLRGAVLGAVPDPFARKTFFWHQKLAANAARAGHRLALGHRYFNAGVLLTDLELWRKGDVGHRCFTFFLDHPHLPHLDQDVLNLRLQGRVQYLEARWNHSEPPSLMWEWDHQMFRGLDPVRGMLKPSIRHMAGKCKPWDLIVRQSDYRSYHAFLDRTEWQGERPPQSWPLLAGLLRRWFDFQWLLVRGFWWPRSQSLAAHCLLSALRQPWMIPLTLAYGVRRILRLTRAHLNSRLMRV